MNGAASSARLRATASTEQQTASLSTVSSEQSTEGQGARAAKLTRTQWPARAAKNLAFVCSWLNADW